MFHAVVGFEPRKVSEEDLAQAIATRFASRDEWPNGARKVVVLTGERTWWLHVFFDSIDEADIYVAAVEANPERELPPNTRLWSLDTGGVVFDATK